MKNNKNTLYTGPKPPSPILLASLKSSVAAFICFKVKVPVCRSWPLIQDRYETEEKVKNEPVNFTAISCSIKIQRYISLQNIQIIQQKIIIIQHIDTNISMFHSKELAASLQYSINQVIEPHLNIWILTVCITNFLINYLESLPWCTQNLRLTNNPQRTTYCISSHRASLKYY